MNGRTGHSIVLHEATWWPTYKQIGSNVGNDSMPVFTNLYPCNWPSLSCLVSISNQMQNHTQIDSLFSFIIHKLPLKMFMQCWIKKVLYFTERVHFFFHKLPLKMFTQCWIEKVLYFTERVHFFFHKLPLKMFMQCWIEKVLYCSRNAE
jgi:hypothetical protein